MVNEKQGVSREALIAMGLDLVAEYATSVPVTTSLPITIEDINGNEVEATLHLDMTLDDLKKIDRDWKPYLDAKVEKAEGLGISWWLRPQHTNWKLGQKFTDSDLSDRYIVGIEFNGQFQGVMVLLNGEYGRLDEQGNKLTPADYTETVTIVDFLAAAPWNLSGFLKQIQEKPRLLGIGEILLRVAVQISLRDDNHGCLGLHSLPQAETFYQKHGMIPCGRDCDSECLGYYELIESKAITLLRGAE